MENLREPAVGGRAGRRFAAVLAVAMFCASCASESPTTPSASPAATVDTLDFIIGDPGLWPRLGDQHQHQTVSGSHVCWNKYSLVWMFECWRWDEQWIYHEVDHGIDARRWEHYTLSDGRWLPRRLTPGTVWSLDVNDNRVRWVNADCEPQPERSMPYRMSAHFEPAFDAGGDLGVRETLVLEYQPDPEHAGSGTRESFYFAKGAGWFMWTRSDGVRVAFNRLGGAVRQPTPWCARDFAG
jgi:hypothetical protein